MNRDEAEGFLADVGRRADDAFPLFEAALACAVHDDPDRDAAAAQAFADEGAERLKARLERESPEEAIAESMAGDLGLQGDLFTYDHQDNADVIAVSQRSKGIPVSLGVFYLHAARRCGLDVRGVDFPGHFLLRIETVEGPLALDPFSEGRVVLPSELSRRALRPAPRAARPHRPPPLARRRLRPRRPGRARGRASGAGSGAAARRRRRDRRPRGARAGQAQTELADTAFLPRRGRGTMRSMVEG